MNSNNNKIARVYDSVLELINIENNPFKITISQIADKSGIGKGTVYEYFKSKDEIFLKTFKYFTELVIKDIKGINDNSFKDMFFSYYDQFIKMYDKCHAAYLTIIFGDSNFNVNEDTALKINDILRPLEKVMYEFNREMLKKGIQEGIISSNIDKNIVHFANMGILATIFSYKSQIGDDKIIENDKISRELCYNCFVKLLK